MTVLDCAPKPKDLPALTGWLATPATDPRVADFYGIWQQLRGDRPFPTREEFRPERISRFLPGVVLLKVLRDPLDFEYRILGGDVVERVGMLRGKRVSEGPLVRANSAVYRNYCEVVEAGRPQFHDGPALSAYGADPMMVSRVHCPLASSSHTIGFIISYVTFQRLPAGEWRNTGRKRWID